MFIYLENMKEGRNDRIQVLMAWRVKCFSYYFVVFSSLLMLITCNEQNTNSLLQQWKKSPYNLQPKNASVKEIKSTFQC